jgi:hypothetical protein
LALIERRRAAADGGVSDVSAKQAEFEVLDVRMGQRGHDEADSQFFAETLPRAIWDSGDKSALSRVERVVLVHRLREVIALVGFTRFEPAGTDGKRRSLRGSRGRAPA